MRQYRTVLTVIALTALLLAGCASDGGGGGRPPAAAPTPTPSVPVTTAPAGKVERVTGRVEAGVEAGCKILIADSGGGYLLLGGPPGVLKQGARVEVEGTVEPGLMTTCQQGRPFKVISAKPA